MFRALVEWKTRKSRLQVEGGRTLQPFSTQTVLPNGRPCPLPAMNVTVPRVCLQSLPRVNYLSLISCSVSMETTLSRSRVLELKKLIMAVPTQPVDGFYYDELSKIRALDPEIAGRTQELKDDCKEFVDSRLMSSN